MANAEVWRVEGELPVGDQVWVVPVLGPKVSVGEEGGKPDWESELEPDPEPEEELEDPDGVPVAHVRLQAPQAAQPE